MIQGVINRMASNSFLLKGWSVIIVSALFALAAKDANATFVYLALFPAISFWSLDGYFLRQEREYRALYNDVREIEESQIDFSLNASIYAKEVPSWFSTCFSVTLRLFHGALIIVIFLIITLFHSVDLSKLQICLKGV